MVQRKQSPKVTLNTLKTLFPVWLIYKAKEITDSNAYRLERDWIHYFENDAIINKPVADLKTVDIKEWFFGIR
ncbi:MAG: hypothetical protein ACERKZ_20280 [Lachnotalea sp.]